MFYDFLGTAEEQGVECVNKETVFKSNKPVAVRLGFGFCGLGENYK